MKKNTVLAVCAVFLALAVSVPMSFGALTGTVFIGGNEVDLVYDPAAGVVIIPDDDDEDAYAPTVNTTLPDEGGHPVIGIQEPGGSPNVVPDGAVEDFKITIPAGVKFCLKVEAQRVITWPIIIMSVEGTQYVTEPLSGGTFEYSKTVYYSLGNLKTDGKTMEAKSKLSDITPADLSDDITICVKAGRETSTVGGWIGTYPDLRLSIIMMD